MKIEQISELYLDRQEVEGGEEGRIFVCAVWGKTTFLLGEHDMPTESIPTFVNEELAWSWVKERYPELSGLIPAEESEQ